LRCGDPVAFPRRLFLLGFQIEAAVVPEDVVAHGIPRHGVHIKTTDFACAMADHRIVGERVGIDARA
jgi:hypothetical protein